jgi:hypothetical protein
MALDVFEGMGEDGAIASPAAVVNAVSDALAPRVRLLPPSDSAQQGRREHRGPIAEIGHRATCGVNPREPTRTPLPPG